MQRITSVILGVAAFASAVYATPTRIVAERGYYTANGVLAGYNGGGASPAAPTQTVHVGGSAGLVYNPEYINCDVGTVVEFQFDIHNHTLTQSTFPEPCVHMQNGADSGFMPSDGTGNLPTFQFTVMSSDPLWFYCRQTGHCQMGMVFAINPPATGNTFDQYKQNAVGSGTSTVTATSTDCTTTSTVTPWTATESWAPAAPPTWAPPAAAPTQMPGYNVGEDGQCQCVCNVAFNNGPVDNLQGIDMFGGQVGNVNIPWGVSGAYVPSSTPGGSPAGYGQMAPAYPSPAYPSPSTTWDSDDDSAAYTPPPMWSPSDPASVNNIANLGVGTVVPLGTGSSEDDTPAATGSSDNDAPAATGSSDDGEDSSDPSTAPPGGFVANGDLGGAAGKL